MFGIAALVLGALGFVVVAIAQDRVFGSPELRVALPALVLTCGAAIVSNVRREHAPALWLAGLGLAAAALVLGWFLLIAVVVAVACAAVVILHAVM